MFQILNAWFSSHQAALDFARSQDLERYFTVVPLFTRAGATSERGRFRCTQAVAADRSLKRARKDKQQNEQEERPGPGRKRKRRGTLVCAAGFKISALQRCLCQEETQETVCPSHAADSFLLSGCLSHSHDVDSAEGGAVLSQEVKARILGYLKDGFTINAVVKLMLSPPVQGSAALSAAEKLAISADAVRTLQKNYVPG